MGFFYADTKLHISVDLCCSLCPIAFLRVFSSLFWCPQRFPLVFTFICFYSWFMLYVCHLYLVTYTDVQHDFHIRECPCRITLPRRVSLVEQELIRFPEQVSSSALYVCVCLWFLLLNLKFYVHHFIIHCSVCPSIYDIWLLFWSFLW